MLLPIIGLSIVYCYDNTPWKRARSFQDLTYSVLVYEWVSPQIVRIRRLRRRRKCVRKDCVADLDEVTITCVDIHMRGSNTFARVNYTFTINVSNDLHVGSGTMLDGMTYTIPIVP